MARRKKGPYKVLTMPMLDAARMYASGMELEDIAKMLGKSVSTIKEWITDPGVQEEIRVVMRNAMTTRVAKAQRVLEEQLDERDAGKGFLSQNAANSILNRYEHYVLGEEQQSITINFTSGVMPVVGMPDNTDDDADDA